MVNVLLSFCSSVPPVKRLLRFNARVYIAACRAGKIEITYIRIYVYNITHFRVIVKISQRNVAKNILFSPHLFNLFIFFSEFLATAIVIIYKYCYS